jgi:hypothetical protein
MLLPGSNAAGDFKLKPILVYHSGSPRALEGIEKSKLPVILMLNREAWLNMTLLDR